MRTEAEILADIKRYSGLTTVPPLEFLRRVDDLESYNWPLTNWYKTMLAVEELKHLTPPPPPSLVDLSRVQSVLILADDPWGALSSPPWYRFWITADLGYRQFYSDGQFIQAAKKQGRWLESWSDCKADGYVPGVGTGPDVAKKMAEDYQLNGWACEGENAEAFQRGYDAGGRAFVADLDKLSGDLNTGQLSKVATGEVVVTAELYRNLQPWVNPDYRNANKGVGSDCIAIYGNGANYSDVWRRGMSIYCGSTPKPNYPALP